MPRPFRFATVLLAAPMLLGLTAIDAAGPARTPTVYGHRGASAYRPEHTLASYELAIDQGADYVEPDLVSTKDGILVARHENEIGGTTDVASPSRIRLPRTTKTIDGYRVTGWFTEDFTLAELKTLRAEERIPGTRPGSARYDGQFEVPTLQEVIDLVKRKEAETGRAIGIIPETKHPSYFDRVGLSLEEPLVATLKANGYDGADARVLIQSFEVANLIELNQMTDVRLVQLMTSRGARPYDFVLAGDRRTYGDLLTENRTDRDARLCRCAEPGQECADPPRQQRRADQPDLGDRRRPPRRAGGGALHLPPRKHLPADEPAHGRRRQRLWRRPGRVPRLPPGRGGRRVRRRAGPRAPGRRRVRRLGPGAVDLGDDADGLRADRRHAAAAASDGAA